MLERIYSVSFLKQKHDQTRLKKPFQIKIIPSIVFCICVLTIGMFALFSSKQSAQVTPTTIELSLANLLNGQLSVQTEQYLQTHIPLHKPSLFLNNHLQVVLGNRQINQVFILKDKMIESVYPNSTTISQQNSNQINRFISHYENQIPCYLGLIPTAAEIYKDELPTQEDFNQQKFILDIYRDFPISSVVDLHSSLSSSKSNKLFYNTDSHWTSSGAYAGYTAIAKSLGETPYSEETFNIEHASYDYYGNLYQKTMIKAPISDGIDIYHFSRESPIIEVEKWLRGDVEKFSSILFRNFLTTQEQQYVFLGKPYSIANIQTNLANGKKLLLFKDSFADPLMQFIPLHYETTTLVDLDLANKTELQNLRLSDYSAILFLYDINTFLTDSYISAKLEFLFPSQ